MKVLLDTNIILDFFLVREPFFPPADRLFEAIGNGTVEGFLSASSGTDIFYICRRQTQSLDQTRAILSDVLALLQVCTIDQAILRAAFDSDLADFEDAVQIHAALADGLDAIVTRNIKDFKTALIPILTVDALLDPLTPTN
jgi:predicted nucleic acid-binding protein